MVVEWLVDGVECEHWRRRVWVFVCGCEQRVVCGRESVYGGFYVSEVCFWRHWWLLTETVC
jgi:hypothetical protein